jgi:hypothetical protein
MKPAKDWRNIMNSEKNIKIIENTLMELEREYQAIKGLILTESDLKCLLYTKLMRYSQFSKPQATEEGFMYSSPLHTELSWFDDNGKLTIKPDLTILEPNKLKVTKGSANVVKLPSKQFSFNGNAIIMELKFIRTPTGITERIFNKVVLKDFNKIQDLFLRLESQGMYDHVFCYFVIFNKTNKTCLSFNSFMEENSISRRHKIIYASGEVDMKVITNNYLEYPGKEVLDTFGTRIGPFNRIGRARRF